MSSSNSQPLSHFDFDQPHTHGQNQSNDPRAPGRDRLLAVAGLYLLVIVSVIPWRSESIYSGGLDAVVVAKAGISILTFALTAVLAMRTRPRMLVGVFPLMIIAFALMISVIGALVAGNASSTFVVAVRVGIVACTILLLLTCITWDAAIACLMTAMGVLACVAAVTGIPSLLAKGRLGGGIPDIHPNELAGLAMVPLVGLTVLILRTQLRVWNVTAFLILSGILVATGSRTSLLALAVGGVVAIVVNGIRVRGTVVAAVVLLPVIYAGLLFSDVLTSLATRDGTTDTSSTLGSRFEAWNVVWTWPWESWEKWIGIGLSEKKIPVYLQFRDEQVLDSSWASLLAQTGLVGTMLLGVLVLWAVIVTVTSHSRRWLIAPIMSVIVLRSVTESGLLDSHVSFVLFFSIATLLTWRSRHSLDIIDARRGLVETRSVRQRQLF